MQYKIQRRKLDQIDKLRLSGVQIWYAHLSFFQNISNFWKKKPLTQHARKYSYWWLQVDFSSICIESLTVKFVYRKEDHIIWRSI